LDAYDLVDRLAHGPSRVAAWNAYAAQTYADKLDEASGTFDADTAEIADSLASLARTWIDYAQRPADPTLVRDLPSDSLPHWRKPIRSHEQLVGMRDALDALRTYVAFDLERAHIDPPVAEELRAQLAAIDKRVETAQLLWIANAPPALRAGIADALSNGLDEVYELGQKVARVADPGAPITE
jgi:hypothetical protein